MNYIKKFEELDYSTYISAADRLSQHGQKSRAEKIKSHAVSGEMKKINDMSFDILVGDSRVFNNAKFHSVQVMREKNANGVMMIFTSDPSSGRGSSNTHKVLSTINNDGSVTWRDFNKFASRRSVNDYQTALRKISEIQPDIKKMMEDMNLSPSDLRVVSRTFYI